MAVSSDGQMLAITGSQDTGCNASFMGYATAAIETNGGERLWLKSITGDYWTSTAGGLAVTITPDGSQVIQTGGLLSPHYGTAAFSADDGVREWARAYNGRPGADEADAIASSPNSQTVFVTGWTSKAPGGGDYQTIAYRTSDGAERWRARYDDVRSGFDAGIALAVAPDRWVCVTGVSFGGSDGADYVTLAYRTTRS